MKKLAILLLVSVFLLGGCGESHTYSGVLKRTDIEKQANVKIKVTKKSDTEGMMYVEDPNKTDGFFIRDCTYGIGIEKSKADELWYPKACGIKGEFAEEIYGFDGYIEFSDKKMAMKIYGGSTTSGESRFEFEGTEK